VNPPSMTCPSCEAKFTGVWHLGGDQDVEPAPESLWMVCERCGTVLTIGKSGGLVKSRVEDCPCEIMRESLRRVIALLTKREQPTTMTQNGLH
jgi:hypothetical protein